jgi:hypothetical protein
MGLEVQTAHGTSRFVQQNEDKNSTKDTTSTVQSANCNVHNDRHHRRASWSEKSTAHHRFFCVVQSTIPLIVALALALTTSIGMGVSSLHVTLATAV